MFPECWAGVAALAQEARRGPFDVCASCRGRGPEDPIPCYIANDVRTRWPPVNEEHTVLGPDTTRAHVDPRASPYRMIFSATGSADAHHALETGHTEKLAGRARRHVRLFQRGYLRQGYFADVCVSIPKPWRPASATAWRDLRNWDGDRRDTERHAGPCRKRALHPPGGEALDSTSMSLRRACCVGLGSDSSANSRAFDQEMSPR